MSWENIVKTKFEEVKEYDIYDDPKFGSQKLRDKMKREREETKRMLGRKNMLTSMIPNMEQMRIRSINIQTMRNLVNDALELVDLYYDIPSVDKMKLGKIKSKLEKIATMLQSSKLIQHV